MYCGYVLNGPHRGEYHRSEGPTIKLRIIESLHTIEYTKCVAPKACDLAEAAVIYQHTGKGWKLV
jgi:hypothetical protein